jgi:Domain of unknown function (DUF4304)
MGKTGFSVAADAIEKCLRPWLRERGFAARTRTFNRATADGLTHVINLQMGRFDPPGTVQIPGHRENLYGYFTINLGVFIPEVSLIVHGPRKGWVRECDCCIRARLGALGEGQDEWWPVRPTADVVDDVRGRLAEDGLPWFERYRSREQILEEMAQRHDNWGASPPRILSAIILAARGRSDQARTLLMAQASESLPSNPRHAGYVRELAMKLGVGSIDG